VAASLVLRKDEQRERRQRQNGEEEQAVCALSCRGLTRQRAKETSTDRHSVEQTDARPEFLRPVRQPDRAGIS